MAGDTLELYYRNAFTLCHLRKFCTLTEYERMIPYELDVYVALIMDHEQQQLDADKTAESIQNKLTEAGASLYTS